MAGPFDVADLIAKHQTRRSTCFRKGLLADPGHPLPPDPEPPHQRWPPRHPRPPLLQRPALRDRRLIQRAGEMLSRDCAAWGAHIWLGARAAGGQLRGERAGSARDIPDAVHAGPKGCEAAVLHDELQPAQWAARE
ncbi:hypothetical protein PG984_007146 [Apiospora sp. TS-2023a]